MVQEIPSEDELLEEMGDQNSSPPMVAPSTGRTVHPPTQRSPADPEQIAHLSRAIDDNCRLLSENKKPKAANLSCTIERRTPSLKLSLLVAADR